MQGGGAHQNKQPTNGNVMVIVVGHLEEALHASTGMLRSHSLVAVRQQKHQSRLANPLLLTGRDELVDDALRVIVEVTELRLPDDQRLRVG